MNNVCQRFPIPIRLWSNFINQKVSCLTSLSLGFFRLPLRFNYVNPIAGTAVRTLHLTSRSLTLSSYRYLYTILSIVVCRFFDLFSCHMRLERRLSITVCTTKCLETRRRCGLCSYNTSSAAGNNKSHSTVRIEAQNLTDTTEADACCRLLSNSKL